MPETKKFELNEKGRCFHVKDVLKDANFLGRVAGYEIFQCKICGYIYCGRLPLQYFLKK